MGAKQKPSRAYTPFITHIEPRRLPYGVRLKDNPLNHGYYAARTCFSSPEVRMEFDRLVDEYLTDLQPQGRFEIDCVVEIARSRWQLDYLHLDEDAHINSLLEETQKAYPGVPAEAIRAGVMKRHDWKNDSGFKFIQSRLRYWRGNHKAALKTFREQQAFRLAREAALAEAEAERAAQATTPDATGIGTPEQGPSTTHSPLPPARDQQNLTDSDSPTTTPTDEGSGAEK